MRAQTRKLMSEMEKRMMVVEKAEEMVLARLLDAVEQTLGRTLNDHELEKVRSLITDKDLL